MTPPLRTYWPWLALAALFVGAPLIFSSGSSLTMMSVMGEMIIFALSFNMLLGQTGLLSFGHAVYFGLGGFVAIHAMNAFIHAKTGAPSSSSPSSAAGRGSRSESCSAPYRPGVLDSSFP